MVSDPCDRRVWSGDGTGGRCMVVLGLAVCAAESLVEELAGALGLGELRVA